jgi:hypothetical protein
MQIYLFAHDTLPTFLSYFPGDKADYAITHVQRSPASRTGAVGLAKAHLLLELIAETAFLEAQFRRKLLGLHGSE